MTFTTTLTGAQESPPNPGDPDGSGIARVTVDTATGRICYVVRVTGIALPATAAHIHKAPPPGVSGSPVQELEPPLAGRSAGCVTDRLAAAGIAANPGDYYVNVHNAPYPSGALRGQL